MKKEARFLKECIGRYLGKQEELDLALVYKKCVPVKLFSLISDQRLEGLMHYLDSRECFINIPLPESIKTRWKTIAWKNSFQNDLTDTNADSIFRQMAVLGLEYVWLKGKAVRMLHKTDYIFSSSDLDLFIDKDTYPELKKLLLSEGYTIPEPEKMMKDTVLDISEFEESMNEIMFVKKDKAINYVIDVQWDFIGFGTKSPLHDLYGINELILSQRTKLDPGSSTYPMSLSTEIHFCVMAIHLCLHHGFRGVKWFVDMANYYLLCSPDLEKLNKEVSRDVMKSVGIEVALIHEYAGLKRPNRQMRRNLCIDRLLPFELSFYRSMLFLKNDGLWNNISHRIIKALLPYRHRDKYRILSYMLLNPDSVVHRVDKANSKKGFCNIFALFRIMIENVKRYRRNKRGK